MKRLNKLKKKENVINENKHLYNENLFTQSEYAKLLGISRSAITVKIYKQQVDILEIQGGVLIKVSPEEYKESLIKKELREKGEPMFIAKQVMQVLELTHVTNTLRSLDEDEKLNVNILHAGQNRNVIMWTESGLYTLVIKSTKPEAKVFRKWVF